MRCPAGKLLKKQTTVRNRTIYRASVRVCRHCELRSRCTKNKTGRTVGRHEQHDLLNSLYGKTTTPQAKRDIKTRQTLMERSFAQGLRYGFKKARWRRLWRVEIQQYLIAIVQNIALLIKATGKRFGGIGLGQGRAARRSFSFAHGISHPEPLLLRIAHWYTEMGLSYVYRCGCHELTYQ
jgi:hypothetical protein